MAFVYRLEKGSPLTDAEIDENFTTSNIDSTYTPTFSGGYVTNHISGTIYFGDITVNDADGSYTGSGDCWALQDGYALSPKVTAP